MSAQKVLNIVGDAFLNPSNQEWMFGPIGRLLLRNIENSWFQHCVTMQRYDIFLSKNGETGRILRYLKEKRNINLPVGLATMESAQANNTRYDEIFNLPKIHYHQLMKVSTFVDKHVAKDLFYKKQQERKSWWRKFAVMPSRFTLSNSGNNEKAEVIDIKADFTFGDVTVETISYVKNACDLETYEGTVPRDAQIVEHTTSLELAFLTFLCDGYNKDNETLYIHPKFAPYKALIYADQSDGKDANLLAVFLNNQLRAANLNTIVSSDQNDTKLLIVPYIVVLDNQSLTSGIVRVNCQLTTIGEKVHITHLVKHIAERCG